MPGGTVPVEDLSGGGSVLEADRVCGESGSDDGCLGDGNLGSPVVAGTRQECSGVNPYGWLSGTLAHEDIAGLSGLSGGCQFLVEPDAASYEEGVVYACVATDVEGCLG